MPKTDRDWYRDYERWVDSRDLSIETKRTYLVHVRRFLRWKEESIKGRQVATPAVTGFPSRER